MLILLGLLVFASPVLAQNDVVYPLQEAPNVDYTRAYVALGVGGALTLGSFVIQREADKAYDRYLAGTDPAQITKDYDEAERLDKWSAATLLAGTGALALGVYWRFIKHPESSKGASIDLEPSFSPRHAGLALAVRFP
jgi:hypothetical protein